MDQPLPLYSNDGIRNTHTRPRQIRIPLPVQIPTEFPMTQLVHLLRKIDHINIFLDHKLRIPQEYLFVRDIGQRNWRALPCKLNQGVRRRQFGRIILQFFADTFSGQLTICLWVKVEPGEVCKDRGYRDVHGGGLQRLTHENPKSGQVNPDGNWIGNLTLFYIIAPKLNSCTADIPQRAGVIAPLSLGCPSASERP